MPYLDFELIRCTISVPAALSRKGWPIWFRAGPQLRGSCPLHGSPEKRSRSLAVTERAWYCHKCRKGGDVIDLWAVLTGLRLHQAAADLCAEFGIKPPASSPQGGTEKRNGN